MNAAFVGGALSWAKGGSKVLVAGVELLLATQRYLDGAYLWAAMGFLSSKLREADSDAVAWTGLVRSKRGIGTATREVVTNKKRADNQGSLFEQPTLTDEGEVQ